MNTGFGAKKMTYDFDTLQKVGGGAAAVLFGFLAIWGARRGDGKPPEDRAPSQHAVREAITEIRTVLINIRDEIDTDRDAAKDRYHGLTRHLDRIEARLDRADAVAAVRREVTIPPRFGGD
jgi:hypothetical protein